ncbi:MAG: hypothetical protein RR865_05340, partial [Clostridia bacterium]
LRQCWRDGQIVEMLARWVDCGSSGVIGRAAVTVIVLLLFFFTSVQPLQNAMNYEKLSLEEAFFWF